MATARLLHRRYIRGEISDQEWEFISKQSTHSRGPINLRSYLDKDWYEGGGHGECVVSLAYFSCTLPSFPCPKRTSENGTFQLPDTVPSFADLLSHERFLLRCNMIKKQLRTQLKHPLFVDIAEIRQQAMLNSKRNIYRQWRAKVESREFCSEQPVNGFKNDLLYTYEWTTVPEVRRPAYHSDNFCDANRVLFLVMQSESMLPSNYPLPPTHRFSSQQHPSQASLAPKECGKTLLRILDAGPNLHPRPTDFYLTVGSSRGHINLNLLWDGNVYADDMMCEWLEEFQAAAVWYLGGDSDENMKGKL